MQRNWERKLTKKKSKEEIIKERLEEEEAKNTLNST